MRSRIVIAVAAIAVFFGIQAGQGVGADELLKPFFLAGESSKSLSATATETKNKLTLGGFEVVGEHSPYENTLLLIVTNDVLKAAAAKSDFGGYAAAQRVSLSLVGDKVQIRLLFAPRTAAVFDGHHTRSGIRLNNWHEKSSTGALLVARLESRPKRLPPTNEASPRLQVESL